MIKKLFFIVIFLLFIPIIYANYAVSQPRAVTVERGAEQEFDFQLQAYNSDEDLTCSYSVDENPFKIDIPNSNVSKGSSSIIKAKLTAPRNIELGDYSYTFCVDCDPIIQSAGSTTKVRFCDMPIDITVIEAEKEPFSVLGIVAVLAIVIIFLFLFFYKRK